MTRIMLTIGLVQILAIFVNMFRAKIVAVLLGPAGVGVISVVDQAVLGIVQVGALALPFAAVRFLSRSHARGHEAFQQTYSVLLRALLLLTSAAAALSLVAVLVHPLLLGQDLLTYRALFIPALLSVPIVASHGFISNVLAAAQRGITSAMVTLGIALGLAAGSSVGILTGHLLGYYWGNLAMGTLVTCAALLYLGRRLKLSVFHLGGDVRKELKANPDIVSFALIVYMGSLALPLANFVARYAVFSRFGAGDAGLLQAALGLSAAISLVLTPTNALYLTPMMNREIPKAEKLRAAMGFQERLAGITAAAAMPLVLFPDWLLRTFYSPAFQGVSSVLFLFVVSQCLLLLGGVNQALLIGLDDLKVYGATVVGGHLIFAFGAWTLSRQYGILGVALGFLAANLAVFVFSFARLAVHHGFNPPLRSWILMGYGVIAVTAAGGIFKALDSSNVAMASLKAAAYVMFLTSVWLLDREHSPALARLRT